MALSIPNTTTTATYTAAGAAVFPPQVGGLTPYASGYLFVANASAFVSVLRGRDQGSASWGPDFQVSPTFVPLYAGDMRTTRPEWIYGVRARDAVAGTSAQVFGGLFQLGEAALLPGSQFVGTVGPGGGFTPPSTNVNVQHNGVLVAAEPTIDFVDLGANVFAVADDPANTRVTVTPPKILTGSITAAGGITAGTGFTVTGPHVTGIYTIAFTVAFATVPVVLVELTSTAAFWSEAFLTAPATVNGFTVNVRNSANAPTDSTWNFLAVASA